MSIEQAKGVNVNDGKIKISAILRLGAVNAAIIQKAYESGDATEKFAAIENIKKAELSDETKLKFIGDIITRPKRERIAIANSIAKLIKED